MEGTEAGTERNRSWEDLGKESTKEKLKRAHYVSLMKARAPTRMIKTWLSRKPQTCPGEALTAREHQSHAAQAGPSSSSPDLPPLKLLLTWSASS